MSKVTDELMAKHGLRPEDIHLPAGGVAIFGRTGTGKSSCLYNSVFVKCLIVADTGSMAHKLFARHDNVLVVDETAKDSPVEQVRRKVEECDRAGVLWALDSFSTLQEKMVAWWKRGSQNAKGPAVNLKDHGAIVGHLRDLALTLARSAGFTIFNTTPGGRGKNPDGTEVVYPAGALTGYPALNGTNANSETVLARWGTVWGVFQGYQGTPRGLYVPGQDIRPESHAAYSPLKDPMMVVRDTTPDEKRVMAVPDLRDPANAGRCFIDELLVEIAAKFPRRKPTPPAADPSQERPNAVAELLSLAQKLKTTPEQLLAKHERQVGAFPKGRPLPKVEDLTGEQLNHLLTLARQQAERGA